MSEVPDCLEDSLLHWDLFDKENYELKRSILLRALLRYDAWQKKAPIKRSHAAKLTKMRLCVKLVCKRERIALPPNYAKQVLEDLRELWVSLGHLRGCQQVDKIIAVINSIGCN
jgi:hypothetical protein